MCLSSFILQLQFFLIGELMKIKEIPKIHIICASLTLLFVLSIYVFNDETRGRLKTHSSYIEYTEVNDTQIDDSYSLKKEIDLSNFKSESEFVEKDFSVFEESDELSSEIIVYFEDISSSISVHMSSDEYLHESGEFNNSEILYMDFESDKWINRDFGLKFKTTQDANYSLSMTYWNPEDATGSWNGLTGIIKIYVRIGGEINE